MAKVLRHRIIHQTVITNNKALKILARNSEFLKTRFAKRSQVCTFGGLSKVKNVDKISICSDLHTGTQFCCRNTLLKTHW